MNVFAQSIEITQIDSIGNVGLNCKLKIIPSGKPFILYNDLSNYQLKYAVFNDEIWDINETGLYERVDDFEVDSLDNAPDQDKVFRKLRDPRAVFVIALVPGFFIHGIGHAYIGDNKAALTLLFLEIGSIATLASSLPYLTAQPSALSVSIISLSVITFLVSWQVDVWRAPDRAYNMNIGIGFLKYGNLVQYEDYRIPGITLYLEY